MHLGYHELRNMLAKFREERDKRKAVPASSTPTSGAAPAAPSGRPADHRSSRDEYRDRDRDRYDRHSTRYE